MLFVAVVNIQTVFLISDYSNQTLVLRRVLAFTRTTISAAALNIAITGNTRNEQCISAYDFDCSPYPSRKDH